MDKLIKQQANVLTAEGFAAYCNALRTTMTYEQAYEETERIHEQWHIEGKRKYSDFSSFARGLQIKRQRQRATSLRALA